jgi:hypothetical protein
MGSRAASLYQCARQHWPRTKRVRTCVRVRAGQREALLRRRLFRFKLKKRKSEESARDLITASSLTSLHDARCFTNTLLLRVGENVRDWDICVTSARLLLHAHVFFSYSLIARCARRKNVRPLDTQPRRCQQSCRGEARAVSLPRLGYSDLVPPSAASTAPSSTSGRGVTPSVSSPAWARWAVGE